MTITAAERGHEFGADRLGSSRTGLRMLMVTKNPPWPAQVGGGAQRTELLLQALSVHGTVDLLLVAQPALRLCDRLHAIPARWRVVDHCTWTPRRQAGFWRWPAWALPGRLGRLAGELALLNGTYQTEAHLAHRTVPWLAARHYDLIVGRYLVPTMRCGALSAARAPFVLDCDDLDWRMLESRQAARRRSLARRWFDWIQVRCLRARVRAALARCAHVWFAKAEDERDAAVAHSSVLPNIPWVNAAASVIEPCPLDVSTCDLLFVGTLSYEPNREGLDHFLRRIWPAVRAAVPQARVRIVGVYLDDATRQRWATLPGVIVEGAVPNLRPAYNGAAVAIAPVYWGGGTKIKVLEALAHGRTCVVTPHAIAGLDGVLRHGESLWCGRNDAEFAEGCVRLLRNPALRSCLAECGRQIVAREFSFAKFQQVVDAALNRLMRRAAA